MPKVKKVLLFLRVHLKRLTQCRQGSHHWCWASGTGGSALSEAEKWNLKRYL
jgi:hypothetical protein